MGFWSDQNYLVRYFLAADVHLAFFLIGTHEPMKPEHTETV